MSVEYIQHTNPNGSISHRIKIKDKTAGKDNIFRSIIELPMDDPLCEMIEEFGIPVVRIEGKSIRYVSTAEIVKKLKLKTGKLNYPQKIITWIHPRESITKQEYKCQVQISTQLTFAKSGRPLTLVSLADAIQILAVLQKDKKRSSLIRKLIVKIEELQIKIQKKDNEELKSIVISLNKLDVIAYDFVKEHGKDYWEGYNILWGTQIWELIKHLKRRECKVLGIELPKVKFQGLHHPDRPYTEVYPYIATRGYIIDKRFKHEDPRNDKYRKLRGSK